MTENLAIFHCGYQKTGTTTLQMAFDRLSKSTSTLGYPRSGRFGKLAHHNLTYELRNDERFSSQNGGWEDVRREILEEPRPNLVISAESFITVNPKDLKQAIEKLLSGLNYSIKVVIYVRPHLSRLLSTYAQEVKMGFCNLPLDEYVREACAKKGLYSRLISRWLDVFGEDLRLSVFDRTELVGGDIAQDFFGRFLPEYGEALKQMADGLPALNIAPNMGVLEVMRIYGRIMEIVGDRQKLHRYADRITNPLINAMQELYIGPEYRLLLSEPMRAQLISAYMDDAVSTDMLMGTGTFFASSLVASGNATVSQPQSMSGEEKRLHEMYLELISQMDASISAHPQFHKLHLTYLKILLQIINRHELNGSSR